MGALTLKTSKRITSQFMIIVPLCSELPEINYIANCDESFNKMFTGNGHLLKN